MLQRAVVQASIPGVDRVLWLRVEVAGGEPAAGTVHGIRHRRPVDVKVSADVARRLLAQGVPTVAHGAEDGSRELLAGNR